MKTLRKQVSEALVSRGFERDRRAHRKRVDADFWLCVDTGVIGPIADIAPFVGFRSDAVEDARADLMGLPRDPWVASAIGNVGYVLGGEYKHWLGGTAPALVVDTIFKGLDAVEPFMSLPTIDGVFAHRWAFASPGAPYVLVVAALLNGDARLVQRRLADAEARLCAQQDEVCEQFQEFKARVLERLADRR